MKFFYFFFFYFFFIVNLSAQTNYIHSGAEILNYSTIDLSINKSTKWETDRSVKPGFLSAIGNSKYLGYSNKFNVNGYVKKYGNTPFVFPIGNGTELRALEISKSLLLTDAYATAWIEGDPSFTIDPTDYLMTKHNINQVLLPINTVSNKGQWDWLVGEDGKLGINTTGNGNGLTITVNIPDLTNFAKAADLRLVGWNGMHWIDLSKKPSATSNLKDSRLSGTMISGITAIAIGKINDKSNSNFKDFIAKSIQCKTVITWERSLIENTYTYILEHSIDSINFNTIYTENTNIEKNKIKFQYDYNQPMGISYYRLKIKNSNDSIYFSETITCINNCDKIDNIWLFPNPVTRFDNIYLRFNSYKNSNGELIIYDNIGNAVLNKFIQYQLGTNTIIVSIRNIPNGTYFLVLKNSKGINISESKKFIKQQ